MSSKPTALRVSIAGFLAWLLPGLGHIVIGDRKRGIVILVTIAATFWSGVAIGGAGATVDPENKKLWFMAQILAGGHTLAGYGLHRSVINSLPPSDKPPYLAHWLSAEIAVHYTGVAGLLNILVILDAMSRAERLSSGNGRKRKLGQSDP